jgi:two-component system response regulator FixJ
MSGMADIALAVEAMKAGAADFLEKPLTSAALVEAVSSAALRTADEPPPEKDRSAEIFQTLTRRQLDVLKGIVEGLPNKLIAYRLGLSPRTVEAYRAAIMERTQAKSLSHLVRMSISAGL